MLRVNRMTDYALLLLSHFPKQNSPYFASPKTARELSEFTGLPLPTVGKLLKTLSKNGFLESVRGVNGGYRLARDPKTISLAEIVSRVDGPIEVANCIGHAKECHMEARCRMKTHWSHINSVIESALAARTLADLQEELSP